MIKNNILITGGAGYIGSVLCSLIKNKYKKKVNIFVIDNLSRGNKKYLNCDKFYNFDLCQANKLNFFFLQNKINEVVHLAAYTNLRDKNYKVFYNNNYLATKNLIENVIQYKIKKFIFASTAAVYGDPKKIPISETAPIKPISHYGKSKLRAEKLIIKNSPMNFKSIILRFFNASGANLKFKLGEDKYPPEHLIPIVLKNFFNKKKFQLYNSFKTNDGTGIRDYIHVDDICTAIIKSLIYLDKANNGCNIFNLGSGVGISSLDIIKKLENLFEKKIDYTTTAKKIGEPSLLLASSKKAKKILNWSTKKNINNILRDAVAWEKHIRK
jgi:UDP-glucose 4-epimerase